MGSEMCIRDSHVHGDALVAERLKDPEISWRDVPHQKIFDLYDAIYHLDAKGLRFYLPAYMICALCGDDSEMDMATVYECGVSGGIRFNLEELSYYKVLNLKQFDAVVGFLEDTLDYFIQRPTESEEVLSSWRESGFIDRVRAELGSTTGTS